MKPISKTGIIYFSLTGHSKRIATKLAEALNGTLIELKAPEYRPGVLGYLRAGFDSLRQKNELAPQAFTSLSDYDRVIVVGPVWTSYPACPLRALLKADMGWPRSVALFLTTGGPAVASKAFKVGERDFGPRFIATASLSNSAEATEQEARIIAQFMEDLHSAAPLSSVN